MKRFLWYLITDRKELLIFLACLIIFLSLLYKDPFSQRTLIPNFDPFPDTIHYVVPARNLAAGDQFLVKREGRGFPSSVKPLYSLILTPGYIISKDPRVFYFTNLLLAILSAVLFFLIIRKITQNIWISGFIFLLYVTNYFIYWLPTLTMAENLLLPLFLVAIWLLLDKVSIKNSIIMSILSIAFYMTKSAAAPLTASFLIIYGLKILIEKKTFYEKIKLWVALGFGFTLMLMLTLLYDAYLGKDNILTHFFSLVSSGSPVTSDRITPTSSAWFSPSYISKNLPLYLNALIGEQMRFLWDYTPIVPKFVGMGAILGLLAGLFFGKNYILKEKRFLAFSLILILFSSILFIATFYTADARYIYHSIPALLIGFALLLLLFFNLFKYKNMQVIFYFILGALFLFYMLTNAIRFKNQIMLNLKYAETPWSYISVLNLNEYFDKNKIRNEKKPIVITPMPAYFIDFYSNGNYSLLPLSLDQEFRTREKVVWGPNDYSDLLKLYQEKINAGFEVFVAIYGLGNEGYLHNDFNKIKEKFNLNLVYPGCYDLCNIYSVSLK